MAGLSEREWVWLMIEETKAELREKDKKLEAVQAKIEEERRKPPEKQDSGLLEDWRSDKAILNKDKTSLHTELQKFQDILAAGGVCVVRYALISTFGCCVGDCRTLG